MGNPKTQGVRRRWGTAKTGRLTKVGPRAGNLIEQRNELVGQPGPNLQLPGKDHVVSHSI